MKLRRHTNKATTRSHYRLTRQAALVIASLLGDTAAALADEPKPDKDKVEKPATRPKYIAPLPLDPKPTPDAGIAPSR